MKGKKQPLVWVVIPTYHPGQEARRLLMRLAAQTIRPAGICVINTEEAYWDPKLIEGIPEAEVVQISKEEFDHAGTRNLGASMAKGDYVLFMTQDALPSDRRLIERLLAPFKEEGVVVSYARQLPREDCRPIERYTRRFNYPKEGMVKSKEDLPKLGIKTFFCSNVCALYDKKAFLDLGGFDAPCVFNEDMVFASRAIKAGYKVAYASRARVIHSHNYSPLQQFHRNFDNGVSQAMRPEAFEGLSPTGEGKRLVLGTARYLLSSGRWALLPELFLGSGAKLAGFALGRAYKRLPRRLVLAAAMNKSFWK